MTGVSDPANTDNMSVEKDLQELLDSLKPELLPDDYVFCSADDAFYGDYADVNPIASFQEREGLTLVMTKESADRYGLHYTSLHRCITLGVHSSLDVVGLTAAVATMLSRHQISANVIAAYYHDHVFVPSGRADEALALLDAAGTETNG